MWLKSVDMELAAGINQWAPLEKFGLVVRLATSEFLVEDNIEQGHADRLRAQLGGGLPGVTPVLRQDAAMALPGDGSTSSCCKLAVLISPHSISAPDPSS